MKIALISNYEPDQSQSMLRYGRMLERNLRARGYEVVLLHPRAFFGRLPFLWGGVSKWARYIDKYLLAPPYLRRGIRGADAVHICDHSNAMYLRLAEGMPNAITCHDLIAIQSARGEYPAVQVGGTGRMLQRWIASWLQRAPYIICVSRKTEVDVRRLGVDAGTKIGVIHHALHANYYPATRQEVEESLSGLGIAAETEYLLHVGGDTWYKNRPGVIRIFAALKRQSPLFSRTKLIMAGRRLPETLHDLARAEGVKDSVIETGTISDEMLRCLYTGAAALLFPSLEEGFGWPILEAQACGCPVITTNRAPMTEIAGEAAILVDAEQPEVAAHKILSEWTRLAELREAGFKNRAKFTEDSMMAAYCAVYEQISGVTSRGGGGAGDAPSPEVIYGPRR